MNNKFSFKLSKNFIFNFLIFSCSAKNYTINGLPDQPSIEFCGTRSNLSNLFLCDADNYLNVSTLDEVDKLIYNYMIKYNTPCDNLLGNKIFILFVESIDLN